MSEDKTTQQIEREDLEARATTLGIKFHPNIGDDKLREKIAEVMADKEPANDSDSKEFTDDGGEFSDAKAASGESDKDRRIRKQKEAAELVRVHVTCMNPNKSEWDGELITAGNNVIGSIKKFVMFNVDYHVPRVIYNILKSRNCQIFETFRDDKGRQGKRGKLIREFNVVELPPLTEAELKDLAQRQAMSNGTASAA